MKAISGCAVAVCLVFMAQPLWAESPKKEPSKAAAPSVPKTNSKLPIEISSDSLEVLQRENRAVFRGHVIAVQGTIRLKADTMIVHYKQQDADKKDADKKDNKPVPPTPPKQPSGVPDEMGAITHIEVEGHVYVATPEESAQGDKGDYDVATKLLHLTGDNVVLTRAKNILRGTEVVYDLDTGHSVLTHAKTPGSPKGDTRVRGVFVPTETKK